MSPGGHYVTRTWPGNPSGQSRRERTGARFRAYVPEPIADHEPILHGALSQLLFDADLAVRQLNQLDPRRAHQMEALARQLLRQESLSSSRIEGLALSHKRIGEAAFDPRGVADERARAVLANIEAMHEAIRVGSAPEAITRQTVLELHHVLMASTEPAIAGKLRDRQNWVGGSWHTPVGAEFVPPPHEEVEPLLDDLARFMNRSDLPAALQAALAHAQFETIHPFADGNGRVGRCLIHAVFKRRGLAEHHVPPVSLLMASDVDSYITALTAYREERDEEWTSYFAQTTVAAAAAGEQLGEQLRELQEAWRSKARARRASTAEKLIDALPGQPVIDVQSAARLAGTSQEAARKALNMLEQRGVLRRTSKRSWGRVWEAQGLWSLLDRFEKRLALPAQPRRGG
jgi:Fic family protein